MKPRILFLDRDGCIIEEPQPAQKVDSIGKLRFMPGALFALARLARETDFHMVMVTNQDGLGTPVFPEERFWPLHELVMDTLASVGVHFRSVHIDKSYPEENLPTRKPGTGMLTEYVQGGFDLARSFMVGDRFTDMQLAANLGAKGILIRNEKAIQTARTQAEQMPEESRTQYDPAGREQHIVLIAHDWEEIYHYLRAQ